LIRSWQIFW